MSSCKSSEGSRNCDLPVPEGSLQGRWTETFYESMEIQEKEDDFKLRQSRFRGDVRKKFFLL